MDHLSQVIQQVCDQTIWSRWQPLEGCWRGNGFPASGGIYCIREEGEDDLIYLGETGNIKQRLAMLKPIYGEEMPYRSPHVAGPHLWALRQAYSPGFEVSIAPFDFDVPIRKGVEYLAIALHRQRFKRSPRANFGRMVAGWRASSSNTAQLVARGLRYRGGPTSLADESHLPSLAPLGPLEPGGSPHSLQWGRYSWSPWCHITVADPGKVQGIYRLRRDEYELLFIGQGQIADRLTGYKKLDVECSWVSGAWFYHQQLEIICDLVATYLLTCAALPPAQFGMSVHDCTLRQSHSSSPDRAWWLMLLDMILQEQPTPLVQEFMLAAG